MAEIVKTYKVSYTSESGEIAVNESEKTIILNTMCKVKFNVIPSSARVSINGQPIMGNEILFPDGESFSWQVSANNYLTESGVIDWESGYIGGYEINVELVKAGQMKLVYDRTSISDSVSANLKVVYEGVEVDARNVEWTSSNTSKVKLTYSNTNEKVMVASAVGGTGSSLITARYMGKEDSVTISANEFELLAFAHPGSSARGINNRWAEQYGPDCLGNEFLLHEGDYVTLKLFLGGVEITEEYNPIGDFTWPSNDSIHLKTTIISSGTSAEVDMVTPLADTSYTTTYGVSHVGNNGIYTASVEIHGQKYGEIGTADEGIRMSPMWENAQWVGQTGDIGVGDNVRMWFYYWRQEVDELMPRVVTKGIPGYRKIAGEVDRDGRYSMNEEGKFYLDPNGPYEFKMRGGVYDHFAPLHGEEEYAGVEFDLGDYYFNEIIYFDTISDDLTTLYSRETGKYYRAEDYIERKDDGELNISALTHTFVRLGIEGNNAVSATYESKKTADGYIWISEWRVAWDDYVSDYGTDLEQLKLKCYCEVVVEPDPETGTEGYVIEHADGKPYGSWHFSKQKNWMDSQWLQLSHTAETCYKMYNWTYYTDTNKTETRTDNFVASRDRDGNFYYVDGDVFGSGEKWLVKDSWTPPVPDWDPLPTGANPDAKFNGNRRNMIALGQVYYTVKTINLIPGMVIKKFVQVSESSATTAGFEFKVSTDGGETWVNTTSVSNIVAISVDENNIILSAIAPGEFLLKVSKREKYLSSLKYENYEYICKVVVGGKIEDAEFSWCTYDSSYREQQPIWDDNCTIADISYSNSEFTFTGTNPGNLSILFYRRGYPTIGTWIRVID